jgi:hypothetical protein
VLEEEGFRSGFEDSVKSVPESGRGHVDQSALHTAFEIQPNSMLHFVMAWKADRKEMSDDGS